MATVGFLLLAAIALLLVGVGILLLNKAFRFGCAHLSDMVVALSICLSGCWVGSIAWHHAPFQVVERAQ